MLRIARRASAGIHLGSQELPEPGNHVGMLRGKVRPFRGIRLEVVELKRRQGAEILSRNVEPVAGVRRGRTPAARSRPGKQFPASLADREPALA